MGATNRYKRIRCTDIIVPADRQRQKIDTTNLEGSIGLRGVLQPIIIDQDQVLIAGGRRLATSIKLGIPDIPCRFFEDLSSTERQIIEWEENIKRSDLDWRDEVRAIGKIHDLYKTLDPEWSQANTAREIPMSQDLLSMYLRVYRDLDNKRIEQATGIRPAYNVLQRLDDRKLTDAMSDLIDAGDGLFDDDPAPIPDDLPLPPRPDGQPQPQKPVNITPPLESILNVDFLEWAPTYAGKPFNLIHCDFPYGTNVFGGDMSGRTTQTTYADNPDVYWELVRCLCQNLDRLMTESAHLVFWLSADILTQAKTLEMFRKMAPSLDFWEKPLIWLKSDNAGILSDHQRGPRHIYETALFASRGDRKIIKATSDAYAAPRDPKYHTSTKPQPVLNYFLSMVVDETTRLLDPTCGSGSALRAAEYLGAAQVLGLEKDQEHYESARSALRSFRALRRASA